MLGNIYMKTSWSRLRRETEQRKDNRQRMERAGERRKWHFQRGRMQECLMGGLKRCSRPHERVNHRCRERETLLYSCCVGKM